MRHHTELFRGGVAVALVALPWVARADHGATRVHQVDERVTREVGDGCQYVAEVHGTLQERANARPAEGDTALYAPRLHVQSRVDCASGASQQLSRSSLTGEAQSREQVLNGLEARGRVRVRHADGRVCFYEPHFGMTAGRIDIGDINESCGRTARGGGP